MLYQMETAEVSAEEAMRLFWTHLGQEHEAGSDFANLLVRSFGELQSKVDDHIRAASEHWRLDRMNRVDRNILRLGTVELLVVPDASRRIVLSEAIELAKRYGTDGTPAFVNGVLDRIASDLGKKD